MNRRKRIVLAVLGVFVIIQFIRPGRINSSSGPTQVSDKSLMLTQLYHSPVLIHQILQQSCMDCHSNHTDYPWYGHVQPVGWWLDYHIRKGRLELNLDEFATYSNRRRISKLRSMKDQLQDGDMPLRSYTWMHKETRLSDTQKAQLVRWLGNTIDSLSQ